MIMKKIYVILVFVLILLFGCGKEQINDFYKEICLEENEIFLYNVVDEKIGIYNTEEFTWYPLYEEENTFQYVFGNDSKYIVSGNSINNGFVLLRTSEDKKKIQKVFDMNDEKSCFFPLATNGEEYYFVMYDDEKSNTIKRNIFTFTEDFKVKNVLKTEQMITSGVIVENKLYYTVYSSELKCYKLYAIDLLNGKEAFFDTSVKLETRDLFCYDNKVCVSDYNNIYCDQTLIKKEYINYIEQNYMIQFYANEENNMVCTIININEEKCLGTFLEPLNYEIDNDKIKIYSRTGIYIIEL